MRETVAPVAAVAVSKARVSPPAIARTKQPRIVQTIRAIEQATAHGPGRTPTPSIVIEGVMPRIKRRPRVAVERGKVGPVAPGPNVVVIVFVVIVGNNNAVLPCFRHVLHYLSVRRHFFHIVKAKLGIASCNRHRKGRYYEAGSPADSGRYLVVFRMDLHLGTRQVRIALSR